MENFHDCHMQLRLRTMRPCVIAPSPYAFEPILIETRAINQYVCSLHAIKCLLLNNRVVRCDLCFRNLRAQLHLHRRRRTTARQIHSIQHHLPRHYNNTRLLAPQLHDSVLASSCFKSIVYRQSIFVLWSRLIRRDCVVTTYVYNYIFIDKG